MGSSSRMVGPERCRLTAGPWFWLWVWVEPPGDPRLVHLPAWGDGPSPEGVLLARFSQQPHCPVRPQRQAMARSRGADEVRVRRVGPRWLGSKAQPGVPEETAGGVFPDPQCDLGPVTPGLLPSAPSWAPTCRQPRLRWGRCPRLSAPLAPCGEPRHGPSRTLPCSSGTVFPGVSDVRGCVPTCCDGSSDPPTGACPSPGSGKPPALRLWGEAQVLPPPGVLSAPEAQGPYETPARVRQHNPHWLRVWSWGSGFGGCRGASPGLRSCWGVFWSALDFLPHGGKTRAPHPMHEKGHRHGPWRRGLAEGERTWWLSPQCV